MKILVTGAAGCVGKPLVNKLIASHHQVLASDIKPSPFGKIGRLEYQQLDISSEAFIDEVKQFAPDVIIHLASILQISKSMPRERAFAIDVTATDSLLKVASEIGVKKFVITTSGAAYGYHPENQHTALTETMPIRGNGDYFYSQHKRLVEELMAKYRIQAPSMEQVVFRPGAIIGPEFEGPVVNLFEQSVITGLIGYPGPFNFIWSEDVVDYLLEAATSGISGTFNIAGDGTLSMKQIANVLNKPYLALPAMLVKTILAILKPLGLIQYGPEQVKFIKYRPVLNNDKIKATFNHQPRFTSIQALNAFIKYKKENE